VYVTVSESPYWNERINFREQLRSNERARKKYEGMKYELSKRLWNDISTYEYKKEEFIQRSL
ncbi:GrpB family protein, partial [Priestia megaterium]